ncbi:MAG: PTS sugar transporter subunit IIC/EAL domain-containing protein [Lachnospiraceae bacterium]|nr:PTS sugar transporter subunit IIC/EAL domain-containing protein [Lachnospiraceae bacterium]
MNHIEDNKKPSIATMVRAPILRLEQSAIVRAVRGGLVSMIPVLLIGAFSLTLKTFPVEGYQKAISVFAGGFIPQLLELVYSATFGVLSVYMTFFISRSYVKLRAEPETVHGGACAASMISFFIVAGAYLPSFGLNNMGPKSMFLALITGLGATELYIRFHSEFNRNRRFIFTGGADRDFNRMLATIAPIAIVAFIFALLNTAIIRIFSVESSLALLASAFNWLFSHGNTGFLKGFFFVFLSSLLWFFGIHGSDTLENVMQTFFATGLAQNQAAISVGAAPQSVLTKEFFDCFVLMGGCGTTICLLVTILLFSRSWSHRGLGIAASFPMLFNINEMMVFGLPIILNPTMLIPFLLTPLVCYSVAYFALSIGLVPLITSEVTWTTPIIIGGYVATGSVAGSILQLVNLCLGIMIYTPFIMLLEKDEVERAKNYFDGFVQYFKDNEQSLASISLIDHNQQYNDFARSLCADLYHDMKRIKLYYQPQYHYDGRCLGVEALMRWEHSDYGMIYPPLAVKLATDGGFLAELEEAVFRKALSDRPKVLRRFGKDIKLSVNVTGTTVVTPRFIQFCRHRNEGDYFRGKHICLEVTEQASLSFDEVTLNALRELRSMGLMLAIDDFSMGQTSLNYLKENTFDVIKLDGSLIRGLFGHHNCLEIVASVTQLAESLNMSVVAEYVETKEQKEALHEIGCDCYQGYLYAPALSLDA